MHAYNNVPVLESVGAGADIRELEGIGDGLDDGGRQETTGAVGPQHPP